jgi:hypothetical protein
MLPTEDGALALAIDRLEWALGTSFGRDLCAWWDGVGRALAQVKTALDRHAAQVESATGLFAVVAERDLLPFTGPARQVAALRQEHRNLRVAVADLQALFTRAARGLDAPPAAVWFHEVWNDGGELVAALRALVSTARWLRGDDDEVRDPAF